MHAFADGWQVLQSHPTGVLLFFGCVGFGGMLMLALFVNQTSPARGLADHISLAASLWVLPALLFSALALLAVRWPGGESALVLLGVLALLRLFAAARGLRSSPEAKVGMDAAAAIVLASGLLALVVLRLAFVQGLLLPQYFDSATHYALIQQLLGWAAAVPPGSGFVFPAGQYYHLGYHVLMAGYSQIAKMAIGSSMLVSGQLVLALMPLALYAPARRLAGSSVAALMAVALAAAGWYMPAFAANWGKYPALFAVLPAIGALAAGLLALEADGDAVARRRLWILCLLMALTAGLVHTRSLAVILAAGGALVLSGSISKLAQRPRTLAMALSLGACIGLAWSASRASMLLPAFEPYYGAGLWPTVGVGVLGILAFTHRPQAALAISLFITLLLAGLIIPLPGVGSILDRSFVELWLFVPFSLLGAVGFAGLVPRLGPVGSRAAAVMLGLAVVLHALAAYDLRASSCCTIVTEDDLVAIDWMGRNLDKQELVAIATEHLELGPSPQPVLEAPVDAGAWIGPLAAIGVVPFARDLDLGRQTALEDMCRGGVRYVYVGGVGRGFEVVLRQDESPRLISRLRLPQAAVFELVACGI